MSTARQRLLSTAVTFAALAEVRSAVPPPPCRQQVSLTVRNWRVVRGPHLIRPISTATWSPAWPLRVAPSRVICVRLRAAGRADRRPTVADVRIMLPPRTSRPGSPVRSPGWLAIGDAALCADHGWSRTAERNTAASRRAASSSRRRSLRSRAASFSNFFTR